MRRGPSWERNLSFRREVLLAVRGFDERFRFFGAEETDLAHRLHLGFPGSSLVLQADAGVDHAFDSSLRDILRRGFGYGRGSARMYLKWWRGIPKVFPAPAVAACLCSVAWKFRPALLVAILAPILMCPQSVTSARANRSATPLVDG